MDELYEYSECSYYYMMDLSRSFLPEDRLTVRIGARNPIFSEYTHSKTHTLNSGFHGMYDTRNKATNFTVSVTLRFGALDASVKKTDTSIENDDLVGRNK